MASIVVAASPQSYMSSIGAMTDAYARMAETFALNPAMGDYASIHTRLELVSAQGGDIELCGGRKLAADGALHVPREARLVFLPAFQITDPETARALVAPAERFHGWLREQAAAGAILGAAGESVWHLAAAGLLDGRSCAIHPRYAGAFRRAWPRITTDPLARVAVSDPILTCGAAIHAPLLVTRLLAQAFGIEVGRAIALRERPAEQADEFPDDHDPLVARARLWIRDHFAGDFRIADLARDLGVGHQSLIRKFRQSGGETPRGFAQLCRVRAAQSMLVETTRSVGEIAQLVGYSDLGSFRQVFRKATGMSPGSFRRLQRAERSAAA